MDKKKLDESSSADAADGAGNHDHERSQSGQMPLNDPKRPPHLQLIARQVRQAIGNQCAVGEHRKALVEGTIDLFRSLRPKDSVDAMLVALAIGLHNQTMECIASNPSNPRDREIKLKYTIRGAATVQKLLSHYEKRRKT
jgi:hypothetical protein